MKSVLTVVLLGIAVSAGCATTGERMARPVVPTQPGIVSFVSSTARMHERAGDFFQWEWKAICERRNGLAKDDTSAVQTACTGTERPQGTIGLALSGGGIRSNAFQLGVLSGLQRTGNMDRIDYISAVSGGSWAAAAYKTGWCEGGKKCANDGDFFREIDAAVQSGRTDFPLLLADYSGILAEVKKSAWFFDLFDMNRGFTVREAWRDMLITNFLRGKDLPLQDLEAENSSRPVTIFNLTHDGVANASHSFPFEMTSRFVGTVADCGNSEEACANALARRLRHADDAAVFWELQETPDNGYKASPPIYLSHAMAMSSGVLPRSTGYLRWSLAFPRSLAEDADADVWRYRNVYDLTDGGHSENLGAFALIERGADLIIMSDSDFDPEYGFGDFRVLQSQAASHLGTEMTVEGGERRLKEFAYEGPSWFRQQEFAHDQTPELLLTVLLQDLPTLATTDAGSAIIRLNEALTISDLYDRIAAFYIGNRLKQVKTLTPDAERLIEETKYYRDTPYRDQWGFQQKRIVKLNRLVLEAVYAAYCPKSRFSVVRGAYASSANKGTFVLLKPPKFLDDFERYLRRKGYADLYNYIEFNRKAISFPMDPTFKASYAPELIRAYYLLGQYLATCVLTEELGWQKGKRRAECGE